ncbi:hypothetical protein ACJJTC_014329 [Scirpophaga incertulas]
MRLFCCLTLFFCVEIYGKDLHVKEDNTTDINYDDEIRFLDFYRNSDGDHFQTSNARYARHIELVTETALEHVLSEIEKKYLRFKNNTRSAIPRIVKQLKIKLRQKNKLKKHKLKKLRRSNKTIATTPPNSATTIKAL